MASTTAKSKVKTGEKPEKGPSRDPKAKKAAAVLDPDEPAPLDDSPRADRKKEKKKKLPPIVRVREDYCKGCGICIEFCPTKTLEFKAGKAFVAHPETCIGCMFCELRCPDFAITVEERNGGDD